MGGDRGRQPLGADDQAQAERMAGLLRELGEIKRLRAAIALAKRVDVV
jgi:hypothetical protein